MRPRAIATLLLLVLLALLSTAARAEKPPVHAVQVDDLGPLLLVGKSGASSLQHYGRALLRKGSFPARETAIRGWAAGLDPGNVTTTDPRAQQRGPVVGIQLKAIDSVVGHWGDKKSARDIADAVRRAGGVPVFLPPVYFEGSIDHLLDRVDKLVLAGGSDLHPSLYGQPIAGARNTNLARDRYVGRVIEKALERGMPVTGICLGMQELNVHLGGTLHQDLATARAHRDSSHPVQLEPDGWLGRITGGSTLSGVASRHHQGIDRLAPQLRCVARSADGVIEAVEGRGGQVRGVQFHPESCADQTCSAVFREIVAQARRYAAAPGRGAPRGVARRAR